jgi:hypothetical protein
MEYVFKASVISNSKQIVASQKSKVDEYFHMAVCSLQTCSLTFKQCSQMVQNETPYHHKGKIIPQF